MEATDLAYLAWALFRLQAALKECETSLQAKGLECSSLQTEISNRDHRIEDILNEKEKMEKGLRGASFRHIDALVTSRHIA
eukprot:1052001-Pyramimonas_sp.AAC.6